MTEAVQEPVDPSRVVDNVVRSMEDRALGFHAFWVEVRGNRDHYAEQLREAMSEHPIVVLVVRGMRFDNGNALTADFVSLLNANKEECLRKLSMTERSGLPAFVLLARTVVPVVQFASPTEAPDWLPVVGGQTLDLFIDDLTWTADALLNAPEARIPDICEHLIGIEKCLATRLSLVRARSHGAVNSFVDHVKRGPGESFESFTEGSERLREETKTPSGFRPSLKAANSWVERLWDLSQRNAPTGLTGPSKALARALALPPALNMAWHESYVAVLARPTNRDDEERKRFARNVILTVGSACQLITAAAHYDAYALYPVPLLRSVSYDLRRALDGAEEVITDAEVYLS